MLNTDSPDLAAHFLYQLFRGGNIRDFALLQNNDLAGDSFNVRDDVRRPQHRSVRRCLRDKVAHGNALLGVKSRRRLVEYYDLR